MNHTKTNVAPARARILIVDDHPAVREGLAMRVASQPDLEVCGQAADIGEALRLIQSARPDVAIIDISLKTGNGIDLIKRIKSRDESIRLLVCSMYDETLYADRALRAGALGYITKDEATERILAAVRRVLEGKIYLSEKMAEALMRGAIGRRGQLDCPPIETLSDRELETFQQIGAGLTTQQIAERMCVSPKTVETYCARILQKLHLASRNELIRHAVQWTVEKS